MGLESSDSGICRRGFFVGFFSLHDREDMGLTFLRFKNQDGKPIFSILSNLEVLFRGYLVVLRSILGKVGIRLVGRTHCFDRYSNGVFSFGSKGGDHHMRLGNYEFAREEMRGKRLGQGVHSVSSTGPQSCHLFAS